MNCKLLLSELLCAALLLGCSSAPKLTIPSGEWEEVNQPGAMPIFTTANTTPLTAASIPTPRAPIAFGAPPAKPVVPAPATVTVPAPQPPIAVGTKPSTAPAAVVQTVVAKVAAPVPATGPGKAGAASVVPAKASTPSTVSPVAPARPVPPPLPNWTAAVGSTLHQTVAEWCKRAGIQLIWSQEDLDYPIEAPLKFQGTFSQAIDQIFPLYDGAKRSFLVDGNTSSQGILYVSERKK